jgi:hypothetical protein
VKTWFLQEGAPDDAPNTYAYDRLFIDDRLHKTAEEVSRCEAGSWLEAKAELLDADE